MCMLSNQGIGSLSSGSDVDLSLMSKWRCNLSSHPFWISFACNCPSKLMRGAMSDLQVTQSAELSISMKESVNSCNVLFWGSLQNLAELTSTIEMI